MRALLTAFAAVWLAAEPPTDPNDTPSRSFLVHCGTLYPGDGAPMKGAWLVVRDGRIESISATKPNSEDLPLLDASDKVVMPGIVAADSYLSLARDTNYNVTPDFVALDGFDFDRKFRSALSGGVTTAYLGNGRNRLVPGQGSVVKLHGEDVVARTLDDSCALQITLGAESTNAPALFEPTISPTSDDPLEPARRQYPSARISQLAVLRGLFADAQRGDAALQGQGSTENRYDPEAFRRVAAGQLPLRIASREARDTLRAMQFAKRVGSRLTLENPYEFERIASRIAKSGANVVLRMPVSVSTSNRGGENRLDKRKRNRPENAAIAADAGITFALAPSRDAELADFLFVAGIAIRHGLDKMAALRAITIDAAKTIGVDDRVGSIATGKDADFLVLSGEPFAVGTMVEHTFVDGEPAFEREASDDLIAIRASRIITAAGPVLRDGTVIVGDGKIKALGEELAIPYGARLIDLGDAVITPGFIDSFTGMGLSGDGTGVPTGRPEQRVADVIRHDDPLFEKARAAGLTTVLVAGQDGDGLSGRMAAVKTGGAKDEHILRDIAAIRIIHDKFGPDSSKLFESTLKRGRDYIKKWQKYEKDLADWEAGKAKKAEETPVEAKEDDPVTGTWECELSGMPMPFKIELVIKVKLEGTKVTGTIEVSIDGNKLPQAGKIENCEYKDGKITGEANVMGNSAALEATVADDQLEGTIEAMGNEAQISGTRVSKSTADDDDDEDDPDDGKPKKPKVDEGLEPIRAWIEKKIPAIIKTARAPAVKEVIRFFTDKEKLPYVLHGVEDAIDTPEILGETAPPVILGPQLVRREKGKVVNAAATLANRGVKLAFATGDTEGSRYLPLHTAHAIRWGLDPQAALEALTIEPARMFKIDDRVGSLERGKDADLVVFSGNPFEMTSRVLLVVCNGRVVFDERAERRER